MSADISRVAKSANEQILSPLMSPFRKGQIAMFHVGRSGSSVLARCLDQHSQMYWKGEILKLHHGEKYDPLHVLKKERRKAGRHYFGFEVKPFHLYNTSYTLPGFIEALHQSGVEHFVLLKRENILRKLVSSIIAEKHTHHLRSGEKTKLVQISLDVEDAQGPRPGRSVLEQINEFIDEYDAIKRSIGEYHTLELTYEDDIFENPLKAYRKVIDFMGRRHEKVEVELKKTNPFPLQELIVNFQEVEAYLEDTEHEWMLYS